ncbi:hypothetical protein FSP39_006025 [Pinctada imbricata]|uniref:TIR domain-containing protein n=1 Tax=Pinctada imbricata TaxID=66713 RepID=A0AA89BIW0_PINIB|nr:hypothetical protein FSP39_006025 [Pinctada imbricata]
MLLHLKYLRTLDLQYNNFLSFDEMDRYIIDMLRNTTFDFKGNIFECTCQYIDSLVWLNRTTNVRNNLICKDGTEVSIILQDIHYFWLKCLSEFWLDFSVIVLLLLMVTLLVVTIGYRNKSFVMYLYIKLKARRHIRQREAETRRHYYKYDVFVSYSHLDYDWVTGQLFQYLSNGLSLEVCLHQKDFIPGEPIASEILRCVESSRKTVFVITRNFLASKWSMMEMDIARHHVFNNDNDTIIVILKEDIPVHEMPVSLRKIWWRIVCLKYPQNDSRFEHEVI